MNDLIVLIKKQARTHKKPVLLYVFVIFCIFYGFPQISRGQQDGQSGFGFANIAAEAEQLADQPYKTPEKQVPQYLLDLNYEQWRDIRFKPDASLWRSQQLPFEIQFFHPGIYYNLPVEIFIVDGQQTKEFPFSSEYFDYGENQFDTDIPEDLGYAGFRIHYNLEQKDYKDEFAVFLGASYFRGIGKNMVYGISARGLAIDTGLDSGEEFPVFTKFWLVKPGADAKHMVVYALLESESYTGAYEFTIRPGKKTTMNVRCRIYQRQSVKKLGIAPLTSMFFYGENTRRPPADNFRPEVHDSDGLLIAQSSGEWSWHPLQNPKNLSISEFKAPNPEGFGLLQRDLDFDHYQDLEAHYNKRPSTWIKPTGGDWGKGHIELIMIPTDKEINDNIVAFWVPEQAKDKKELSFSYDIHWYFPEKSPHGGGVVDATLTTVKNEDKEKTRTFFVDFRGGKLAGLDGDAFPGGRVSVDKEISVVEQQVQKNPYINGWRMAIKIRAKDQSTLEKVFADKSGPIHLRSYLHMGEDVLSETWSYSFYP